MYGIDLAVAALHWRLWLSSNSVPCWSMLTAAAPTCTQCSAHQCLITCNTGSVAEGGRVIAGSMCLVCTFCVHCGEFPASTMPIYTITAATTLLSLRLLKQQPILHTVHKYLNNTKCTE